MVILYLILWFEGEVRRVSAVLRPVIPAPRMRMFLFAWLELEGKAIDCWMQGECWFCNDGKLTS